MPQHHWIDRRQYILPIAVPGFFAMRAALLIAGAFFSAWRPVYGAANGQVASVNSDLETTAPGNVGLDPALLQALTAYPDADRWAAGIFRGDLM